MKQVNIVFILIYFLLVQVCSGQVDTTLAKFEPEKGKCLLFIGQDLGAVGGLDNYNDGYCDYFEIPHGITVYSNLSPGSESFGYYNKGLDGLKNKGNWGAGNCHAQLYLEDSTFQKTMISIGLSIVGHEEKIAKGTHDNLIKELANWIEQSNRKVFLRIGYEFDGWEWNHYKRKPYLKAWKRIHSIFNELQVKNVAFVWQSKGHGSDQKILEKWYPGDDMVDWCAYSYFGNPDEEMLIFARKHNKPVFIAEATPVNETDGLFYNTDLKNENVAIETWDSWFEPFFETIEKNNDVIKAISYINVNWSIQPMWIINPVFKQVDSRVQVNETIKKNWEKQIAKPIFYLQH